MKNYIGIVVEDGSSVEDPLGLGRLKVYVPEVHPIDISAQLCPWAMVVSPNTASGLEGRGESANVIENFAQVLVVFLDELKQHPVILGSIPYVQNVAEAYELAAADRPATTPWGPGSSNPELNRTWNPLSGADVKSGTVSAIKLWEEMVPVMLSKFKLSPNLAQWIVAGFIGNMKLESSFRLDVTNSIGCIGLIQWCRERKVALSNFSGRGDNWKSLEMQLNFLYNELEISHKEAWAAIKTASSAREAAAIIDVWYEISEGTFDGSRYKTAKQRQGFPGISDSANRGGKWWYTNHRDKFTQFATSGLGDYLGKSTEQRIIYAEAAYNALRNLPAVA